MIILINGTIFWIQHSTILFSESALKHNTHELVWSKRISYIEEFRTQSNGSIANSIMNVFLLKLHRFEMLFVICYLLEENNCRLSLCMFSWATFIIVHSAYSFITYSYKALLSVFLCRCVSHMWLLDLSLKWTD